MNVIDMVSLAFLHKQENIHAGSTRGNHPLISPLYAFHHNLPRLIIEGGSHEVLYDDAVLFADKAAAGDVKAQLNTSAGLFHVYHSYPDLPEAHAGTRRIGNFLSGFAAY